MSRPPAQPPRPAGPSPAPRPTPKPQPKPASQPKPKNEVEELLPVSELAALWRCSVDHIYDLIARHELRTVQLGTGRAKTRIPASAAAEFIAKRSTKGRAA
jgi:excisionase family DNA binding protein